MKTVVRVLFVFMLSVGFLPVGAARAATTPADPTCALVAAQLGLNYESVVLDGAITCTLYPKGLRWNRDVVFFAHGYNDARQPIGIPWDTQLVRGDVNLPQLVTALGYAFSTTSYRANGLAVQEGLADVVALANHIRAVNSRARRFYLAGASEGGLVTALGIERYPTLFTGGLSTCGPIGSFRQQVQYWEDFRVAFDQAFPTLLYQPTDYGPSTPIYIDPFVVQNWEGVAAGYVLPTLAADPGTVAALLAQTGVPYDAADPEATAAASILELLYYNVQSTNDGRLALNPSMTPDQLPPPSLLGNPYSNPGYVTPEYPTGLLPDPVALANLKAYETTGKPGRPLIILHTTGDPVIPISQPLRYVAKALAAGRLSRATFLPINRYGHCNFTPVELVLGFYTMVFHSTHTAFSSAQLRAALPDSADRAAFKQLKQDMLDNTK